MELTLAESTHFLLVHELRIAARTSLFVRATSLGGVESLIEHRNSSEGPGSKTAQNLLRLSVGLEHAGDFVADLAAALA